MVNPYNPSFGRKPERFLGRDIVVQEVVSALGNRNSPWRTTLLVGVRGSGKTALLNQLSESVNNDDCIVVSVIPGNDILNEVLSQLYSKMPKSVIKSIPKPSKLSIAGGIELDVSSDKPYFLNNFRYQITAMLNELSKKKLRVLFLIDESQKHSKGMRTLIATYQHLISEEFDVHLVMAGLPNVISDILNDDVLTFLRRANQVILDNVDLSLVKHDYEETFLDKYNVPDEILSKAARITQGYPYLIQLVGFYLWEFLISDTPPEQLLDKVVLQTKAMMFSNVHKLLYRELSSGDKEFVNAMAVDLDSSKFADIISRTRRTKNHLSSYRLRLIDYGYIKAVGHGEVAFCLPFTKEFLEQEMEFKSM